MKKFFLLFTAIAFALTAAAVPAKRTPWVINQSDGTSITIVMHGDEFYSSFMTDDLLTVGIGVDGDVYYRTVDGLTNIRAHNSASRDANEQLYVEQMRDQLKLNAIEDNTAKSKRKSARRKVGSTQVPTSGSPRVPIILIQYKDKKMSNPKSAFIAQYTSGATSAYQYFADQSNGIYTPQFDVYGIYTLDNNRSVYGAHSGSNKDKGVGKMVGDAIDKAGNDINWSQYDNDGDGEADVCIVVYAGVGEAQASTTVPEAIWPCQWSLSSAAYYSDGDGARYRNNTTIDRFAVFNEVTGSDDNGTQIDGVGTFCHEFSHCLGLPDFYETTYGNGYYGIGSWSLMDYGCYNNDGYLPIGYSAYEKNFMGWLNYITPAENTQYTLPAMNQKSADTDKAVKIVSPLNSDEYFILENRRQQGWDEYIADQGLMITHVTYMEDQWSGNTVNNQKIQLFTIIPADNSADNNTEDTDLYGETNHEFTSTSTPASKLNLKANGSLASSTGGAGIMDKPVTDIYINNDGSVRFWYMKKPYEAHVPVMLPADSSYVTLNGFRAEWTDQTPGENISSYTLQLNEVNSTKAPEILAEFDFSNQSAVTNGSTLANIDSSLSSYLGEGWTGSYIFMANGALLNWRDLMSPVYENLDQYGNKISVVVTAYAYYSSNYGDAKLTVSTTADQADVVLDGNTQTCTFVLDAGDEELVDFICDETDYEGMVAMKSFKIYAGDINANANAPLLAAVETGDSIRRVITGITDKYYDVTNLLAGGTYDYMVKSIYFDGSESEWSNVQQITLFQPASDILLGDVNDDKQINALDVTALINRVLGGDPKPFNERNADMDANGDFNAIDVTALINLILSH